MHLVLNEEVDQGHQRSEEGACKQFAELQRRWILGTKREAAQCPRKCCDKVRDHEDIMPVVVIG